MIASLRGRFRACYQHGLNCDHDLAGRVVVTVRVVADGTVQSACISREEGLNDEVLDCIADVLEHAQFSAPISGRATINVPIPFVQQTKK